MVSIHETVDHCTGIFFDDTASVVVALVQISRLVRKQIFEALCHCWNNSEIETFEK